MSTKNNTQLSRHWGWLFTFGIFLVILGCVGLSMTVGLTLASVFLFGIILGIAGITQFIDAFHRHFTTEKWGHILIGLLYLLGGFLMIRSPVLASTIITVLLAWVLILIGLARIMMALTFRKDPLWIWPNWIWLLFSGMITLILGILILAQWPDSGLWIIGLFIAIELLVAGWSTIFMAVSLRH